ATALGKILISAKLLPILSGGWRFWDALSLLSSLHVHFLFFHCVQDLLGSLLVHSRNWTRRGPRFRGSLRRRLRLGRTASTAAASSAPTTIVFLLSKRQLVIPFRVTIIRPHEQDSLVNGECAIQRLRSGISFR